jgi:hypothetical protein
VAENTIFLAHCDAVWGGGNHPISPALSGTRGELRPHEGDSGGNRRRKAETTNQSGPKGRAAGIEQPASTVRTHSLALGARKRR